MELPLLKHLKSCHCQSNQGVPMINEFDAFAVVPSFDALDYGIAAVSLTFPFLTTKQFLKQEWY